MKSWISILVGILLLTGTSCEGAAAKPNILLIVVDDMGYSDVGGFGG